MAANKWPRDIGNSVRALVEFGPIGGWAPIVDPFADVADPVKRGIIPKALLADL